MAILYVTEYVSQGMDQNAHHIPVAALPSTAQQTIGITSSSASSTSFQNNTGLVRLHTDAICSIAFGTSPVASATTARMAANQTEYFSIPASSGYKVAVITNT